MLLPPCHPPLGVAPRAKVNQQRSRRFRTAKEAEVELQKALRKDPSAAERERFDSNCITPGTEFMRRMSEHLRYFIVRRIAEDVTWRNVQVIFSGPEVPGEGEHKIMEYIRLAKAKPDYDPNVRHCLYGLDADLILLGLLSHDPHFALLREEVTFGRGAQMKKTAADTRFYLLHLCLMREYMEMEFRQFLAGTGSSPFYLEGLLDDFILLMCLVGNDFLPNVPNFHLGEGVLETLFTAYKRALPRFEMGGHLNENGRVSFHRLALVLEELVEFEKSVLLVEQPSLLADSTETHIKARLAAVGRDILDNFLTLPGVLVWECPTNGLGGKERALITQLATQAQLRCRAERGRLILEKDPTSQIEAILPDFTRQMADLAQSPATRLDAVWAEWKCDYYRRKVDFDPQVSPESLEQMMTSYAEGLQWVMRYYYEGVASWSWFYPYHYAPHISDLAIFLRDFSCDPFDLAAPLRPLEQLMAVLPPASAKLLPTPLAQLMASSESPIRHFYPKDFKTDANGKKASWEAIVKIPFIDEQLLLPTMRQVQALLKKEEVERNQFGPTITFDYRRPGTHLAAPSTDFAPLEDVPVHMVPYELPVLQPNERFVAALCKGVRLGLHAMPGFPTLATLPVSGVLDSGIGLEIFGQPARGLTLVLAVAPGGVFGPTAGFDLHRIAPQLVGRRVYMNWPHLREGLVARLTDGCHTYERDAGGGGGGATTAATPPSLPRQSVVMRAADASEADNFEKLTEALGREYKKRCAVLIGETPAIAWIRPFMGMKMAADGSTKKQFSDQLIPVPVQTLVLKRIDASGREIEDERYEEVASRAMDISSLFPPDCPVLYLGGGAEDYGSLGSVICLHEEDRQVRIRLEARRKPEPSFPYRLAQEALREERTRYMSVAQLARTAGMSTRLVSKLTSSMVLFLGGDLVRSSNLGLEIKSSSRKTASLGLARQVSTGWEFAPKVAQVLAALKTAFPDIVRRLEDSKQERNPEAASIFPQVADREGLAAAVAPWQYLLKLQLGKTTATVPADGDFLSADAIRALREAWLDYKSRGPTRRELTEMNVSAESLLSPLTAPARLQGHQQQFSLGHRIIHLGSGVVPFGARGTVVGRAEGRLWVMLDAPLAGVGKLEGLVEEEGLGTILEEPLCLNLNWIQPPPGTVQQPPKDSFKDAGGHMKSIPRAPAPARPAWKSAEADAVTTGQQASTSRPKFAIVAKKPEAAARATNIRSLVVEEGQPIKTTPNRPVAGKEETPALGAQVRRSIKIEDLFAAASISSRTQAGKDAASSRVQSGAPSIARVEYRRGGSSATTANRLPVVAQKGVGADISPTTAPPPRPAVGVAQTSAHRARITYDTKATAGHAPSPDTQADCDGRFRIVTQSSKGLLGPDLQRLPPRPAP